MQPLTGGSKVPQSDLGSLHLPGYIFGHTLVDSLVCLPGVLDHQGPVFQEVQATVISHVQSIAVRGGHRGGDHNQLNQ